MNISELRDIPQINGGQQLARDLVNVLNSLEVQTELYSGLPPAFAQVEALLKQVHTQLGVIRTKAKQFAAEDKQRRAQLEKAAAQKAEEA